MRALITGATGYLGLHLARLGQQQGHDIHALVRPTSDCSRLAMYAPAATLHVADDQYSSIAEAVAKADADVVFHLASEVRASCPASRISSLVAANIALGTHVCEALIEHGRGHLVTAGTFWEYSKDGAYAPNSLYAATKRAFHDITVHYVRNHGLRVLTLVVFDVFGPGDWRGKLLPTLAAALVEGRPMVLTAGEQLLDLVHVSDVANGFLTAGSILDDGRSTSGETFSLSSGGLRTLKSVVDELSRVLKCPNVMKLGGVAYPKHQIFHPVSTLPILPGWYPEISVSDGLAEIAADAAQAFSRPAP